LRESTEAVARLTEWTTGIRSVFLEGPRVDWFLIAAFAVAALAGGAAGVVGFGIGSILTPVLAYRLGTEAAIPAVAIPHAAATAVRLWRLRQSTNKPILLSFGILSACAGLVGAFVYARLHGSALAYILGALLIVSSVAQLTGLAERIRPGRTLAWTMGSVSGFFGGVAGNQGGIRAAALSIFDLSPREFVATATAVALMVDLGRTPVYVWRAGAQLLQLHTLIVVLAAGTVAGTFAGERILGRLPRARFRNVVSYAVAALGLWLIIRAA
jgi:uncharacterized membrane protein YfcA